VDEEGGAEEQGGEEGEVPVSADVEGGYHAGE
jgi:hypothetical protein